MDVRVDVEDTTITLAEGDQRDLAPIGSHGMLSLGTRRAGK
jgi:hypothetical protein